MSNVAHYTFNNNITVASIQFFVSNVFWIFITFSIIYTWPFYCFCCSGGNLQLTFDVIKSSWSRLQSSQTDSKIPQNVFAAGVPPQIPLPELTTLPQIPSRQGGASPLPGPHVKSTFQSSLLPLRNSRSVTGLRSSDWSSEVRLIYRGWRSWYECNLYIQVVALYVPP